MVIDQMEKLFMLKQRLLYGKAKPEQIKFIQAMKDSNALAGFAHSVEEAINIVFPKKET